jgi:hypothetical protein
MREDDVIRGYILDHEAGPTCRRLLREAATYERHRELNKAREIYRRIMRDYSETRYFDQAAERLANLPL